VIKDYAMNIYTTITKRQGEWYIVQQKEGREQGSEDVFLVSMKCSLGNEAPVCGTKLG
jgi:hypothetical protein